MTIAFKIRFRDDDASYRRVHQLPIDRDDFDFGSRRKRAFEFVFLRIDNLDPLSAEMVMQELLADPEILGVTRIPEEEFWSAPSHGM